MYNQMSEGRGCFPLYCLRKLFNFLTFLAMIGLIILACIHWNDLTVCYKREVAILCVCMIYWRCTDPSYPAVVWEAFQFFIIFLLGDKYNKNELELHNPQCLDAQGSIALFMINVTYKTALLCYAFLCSVYGLFIFMAVLMMIFRHIFVRPRRRRHRGLDQKQFEDLEQIEYHREEGTADTDQMCAICLADFEENERITQLPICNHYFHKECIQQWLKDNPGCPYCRANIKKNLRAWKRMRNRPPPTAPISEMELPNTDSRQLVV